VQIAFLYLPHFSGPAGPLEENFYVRYGPVFKADFVNENDGLFLDYAHLNRAGALMVTDWLTDVVAPLIRNDRDMK